MRERLVFVECPKCGERVNEIRGLTPEEAKTVVEQWPAAVDRKEDTCWNCGIIGAPSLAMED